MLKRIAAGLLTVLLLGGMAEIYLHQKTSQSQQSRRLEETNSAIHALEAERSELEARLEVLNATLEPEEAENVPDGQAEPDAKPAETGVSSGEPANALLCLNAVSEETYSDIYPVLEEAGVTGVLILRNGRMPGDNYAISVGDFVEMTDHGWDYAISLEREENETDAEWQEKVEEYTDRLRRRVGILPTIYCFPEGTCSEEEAAILTEEGFDTILVHQQTQQAGELNVIRLLPYNVPNLSDFVSSMTGYCGLEMWVSWTDETDETLRYSEEGLSALLDENGVALTGRDALLTLSAAQEQYEDQPEQTEQMEDRFSEERDEAEQIQARIAEIDDEIAALYRGE